MHFSSAYLLVSHGSRDSRPQIALEHLAGLVVQRLCQLRDPLKGHLKGQRSEQGCTGRLPLVGTAVLELAPLPLHQQIRYFAEQAIHDGYDALQILPLFLLEGVHVAEDIPAEIELAQQGLGNINLYRVRHLGGHERLWELLRDPIDSIATDPRGGNILLAHGSRRTAANLAVEQIAARLGALPAYWSVAPSLETQVTALLKKGHQQIRVLPYFLFEGGITDAITRNVAQLRHQFPYAQIHLARPIGATPALAERVVELTHHTQLHHPQIA